MFEAAEHRPAQTTGIETRCAAPGAEEFRCRRRGSVRRSMSPKSGNRFSEKITLLEEIVG
jgi:hypothetical protein